MKSDIVYLKHINDAIKKIEKYLKGYDFVRFSKTDYIMDAVVREVQIIGEAANNLSEKFCDDNKEIEWRYIRGARNRVVHEYFNVDLEIIWEIYKNDFKILKKFLKKIV